MVEAPTETRAQPAARARQGAALSPLTLVGGVVVALAVCAVTLHLTGAAHAPVLPGLPPPDQTTPWLLPLVRLVSRLAQLGLIGFLIASAVLLPGEKGHLSPQSWLALRRAAAAGALWAITQIAMIPLTAADLLGVSPWTLSANRIISTMRSVETGQVLMLDAGFAIVAAAIAQWSMRRSGAVAALVVAFVAIVPQAASGHASVAGDHQIALSGMMLHLSSVLVWAGGLAAVVLVARNLSTPMLATAAARFSRIAAPAAAIAVLSGLVEAELRLGFLPSRWLTTNYGLVVIAKLAASIVLLSIGAWHRKVTLVRLQGGSRLGFLRLAAGECLLLAATFGLATALGRTAPPPQLLPETNAQTLLGYPMPPPLTTARLLFDWYPEPIFLTAGIVAIGLYLAGVRRLHRSGVLWPKMRVATWVLGWVIVILAMCSGMARYAPVLVWMHMTQHLLLAMYAAPLLALSAPVTLALRALRPASDPDLPGPREFLMSCIQSRYSRIITQPVVAMLIFSGSTFAVFYSGLLELMLRSHVMHVAVSAEFLISGYLFYYTIIGIDPSPVRASAPVRLFVLLISTIAHTVFGVSLMASSTPLAAGWFAQLDRPWGPSEVSDTQTAGGLAWAFGELPAVVILLVFVFNWARADDREARRRDRAAEIKGSAEAVAYDDYNAMLAKLAEQDRASR